MTITTTPQTENEQYLRILSIFHYVVGGLGGLFACFPIFHFVIGVGMLMAGLSGGEETLPMAIPGLIFTIFAGSIMAVGWAFAIAMIFAGRYLSQRTRYMFCLVMAGIECMFTPFGTVLGVFTIILLMRPEVKTMFGVVTAPPAQPAS